jgi:hypothetical protein
VVEIRQPHQCGEVGGILLERRSEGGDLFHHPVHHRSALAAGALLPHRPALRRWRPDHRPHAEVPGCGNRRGRLFHPRLVNRVRDDVADQKAEQNARREKTKLITIHRSTSPE